MDNKFKTTFLQSDTATFGLDICNNITTLWPPQVSVIMIIYTSAKDDIINFIMQTLKEERKSWQPVALALNEAELTKSLNPSLLH